MKVVPTLSATLAVGGVACAIVGAVPSHADDNYIATAFSVAQNRGEAEEGKSRSDAESAAMSWCATGKNPGEKHASDCVLAASGGPGGCVALAYNGQTYVGAWAGSRVAATAAGSGRSGGGKVVEVDCVGDPGL